MLYVWPFPPISKFSFLCFISPAKFSWDAYRWTEVNNLHRKHRNFSLPISYPRNRWQKPDRENSLVLFLFQTIDLNPLDFWKFTNRKRSYFILRFALRSCTKWNVFFLCALYGFLLISPTWSLFQIWKPLDSNLDFYSSDFVSWPSVFLKLLSLS